MARARIKADQFDRVAVIILEAQLLLPAFNRGSPAFNLLIAKGFRRFAQPVPLVAVMFFSAPGRGLEKISIKFRYLNF